MPPKKLYAHSGQHKNKQLQRSFEGFKISPFLFDVCFAVCNVCFAVFHLTGLMESSQTVNRPAG
jgi:hypothetical protein